MVIYDIIFISPELITLSEGYPINILEQNSDYNL